MKKLFMKIFTFVGSFASYLSVGVRDLVLGFCSLSSAVAVVSVVAVAVLPDVVFASGIPTTVPSTVTTAVDNALLFIGAAGSVVLGVISTMALIKWIRGVLF